MFVVFAALGYARGAFLGYFEDKLTNFAPPQNSIVSKIALPPPEHMEIQGIGIGIGGILIMKKRYDNFELTLSPVMNVVLIIITIVFIVPLIIKIALLGILHVTPVEKPSFCEINISMAQFQKLDFDMTLEQVETVIGCKANEIIAEGSKTRMPGYYWRDRDYDTIWVQMTNGKLTSFSATGSMK